jgi:hypothetical protein
MPLHNPESCEQPAPSSPPPPPVNRKPSRK